MTYSTVHHPLIDISVKTTKCTLQSTVRKIPGVGRCYSVRKQQRQQLFDAQSGVRKLTRGDVPVLEEMHRLSAGRRFDSS